MRLEKGGQDAEGRAGEAGLSNDPAGAVPVPRFTAARALSPCLHRAAGWDQTGQCARASLQGLASSGHSAAHQVPSCPRHCPWGGSHSRAVCEPHFHLLNSPSPPLGSVPPSPLTETKSVWGARASVWARQSTSLGTSLDKTLVLKTKGVSCL